MLQGELRAMRGGGGEASRRGRARARARAWRARRARVRARTVRSRVVTLIESPSASLVFVTSRRSSTEHLGQTSTPEERSQAQSSGKGKRAPGRRSRAFQRSGTSPSRCAMNSSCSTDVFSEM